MDSPKSNWSMHQNDPATTGAQFGTDQKNEFSPSPRAGAKVWNKRCHTSRLGDRKNLTG